VAEGLNTGVFLVGPSVRGAAGRGVADAEDGHEAADDSDYLTYVTPEELEQLNQELHAVLERFWDRLADPAKRPPGALPVETLLLSYPIEPPPERGDPEPHASSPDRPT